jgi:hypothetical protein
MWYFSIKRKKPILFERMGFLVDNPGSHILFEQKISDFASALDISESSSGESASSRS